MWAVLKLLDRWGRLPLSDLERLLGPGDRPRFRLDLVEDMAWEGLINLERVGDEEVLELLPLGRERLAGQRLTPAPPPVER